MTAMEPPVSFEADAIRSKKVDVFAAIKSVTPDHAVRGQYDAGTVLGKPVVAYRSEPNVDPHSNVETYVALKLAIDNWRWAGVPFYLRTGKYMTRRTTEIAIRFKQAPMSLFSNTECAAMQANWLVMQIQPDEGISLQFEVKRPGPLVDLQSAKMNFAYKDWFPPQQNVGYETLLYDVMIGDQTLFQRADQVDEGWRIVQPVLDAWAKARAAGLPELHRGNRRPVRPPMSCWRATAAAPGAPSRPGAGPKSLVCGTRPRERARLAEAADPAGGLGHRRHPGQQGQGAVAARPGRHRGAQGARHRLHGDERPSAGRVAAHHRPAGPRGARSPPSTAARSSARI